MSSFPSINLHQHPANVDHVVRTMCDCYRKTFNEEGGVPRLLVKAPGRVNIIGEHIDYCGYGVLPMAIDRHTFILIGEPCSSSEDIIFHVASTESKYSPYKFNPTTLDIEKVGHEWYKYVMCGLYAVKSLFPAISFKALNILISGSIPIGCGLSSSSSLVVCSALAICAAHNLTVSKDVLANECSTVEKYVGTAGGGMDQAISCLAEEGMAKYITFNPLNAEDTMLPKSAVFVVANSMSSHHKAEKPQYNTRVVECRIGVKILSKRLGVKDEQNIRIPIDLENEGHWSKDDLIDAVKKYLKVEGYSRQEVMDALEISEEEFRKNILTANTQDICEFRPRQRLLHVFQESDRVKLFIQCCNQAITNELNATSASSTPSTFPTSSASTSDAFVSSSDVMRLGCLMNESHSSCRDLYECSSVAQDSLVELMRVCGCSGARLTGAGWGGCVVALVPDKAADEFVHEIKERFYKNVTEQNLDDLIFLSKPAKGAEVISLQ